jgi:hypothetical protein
VHHARVVTEVEKRREVLARHPDGEVCAAVTIEIADRQRAAEIVVFLGILGEPRPVLLEERVPERTQSARIGASGASVHHLDRARHRDCSDAVEGHTDREVVIGVAVEASGRERPSERVAFFGLVAHPGAVLMEDLIALVAQLGSAAVDDLHCSRACHGADALAGYANCQVVEPVAVEVAGRKSSAERVVFFGGVDEPPVVLGEELRSGRGEPGRRPIQNLDGSCVGPE